MRLLCTNDQCQKFRRILVTPRGDRPLHLRNRDDAKFTSRLQDPRNFPHLRLQVPQQVLWGLASQLLDTQVHPRLATLLYML